MASAAAVEPIDTACCTHHVPSQSCALVLVSASAGPRHRGCVHAARWRPPLRGGRLHEAGEWVEHRRHRAQPYLHRRHLILAGPLYFSSSLCIYVISAGPARLFRQMQGETLEPEKKNEHGRLLVPESHRSRPPLFDPAGPRRRRQAVRHGELQPHRHRPVGHMLGARGAWRLRGARLRQEGEHPGRALVTPPAASSSAWRLLSIHGAAVSLPRAAPPRPSLFGDAVRRPRARASAVRTVPPARTTSSARTRAVTRR